MGRKQFESVVAQAPRKRLTKMLKTETTSLAAGGSETISFYAPAGFISKVVSMALIIGAPAGATTGTHYSLLLYGTGTGNNVDLARIESAYNQAIFIANSEFVGSVSEKPSNSQVDVISSIKFDDAIPFIFVYKNNTDVVQNGERKYFLIVEEEQITK